MNDFIKILIVEDNDMNREMLANILFTRGYTVLQASDGQEGLELVAENDVHLALVDINMTPMDGIEFIKNLLVNKINLPTIIVSSDTSSDLLSQAIDLGVQKVLQKPVAPNRLLAAVDRIIERLGINPDVMFVEKHTPTHSHEDLMMRAIELAENNAKAGKGRPFGAIVADKEGHILGSGTNGITSRIDPSAHAEVMAMRQAAERLGHADLSDCILYCSSEPTMIGQALIASVEIKEVYYGLSHDEVAAIRKDDEKARENKKKTKFKQLCHDEAEQMLKRVES